MSTVELLCDIRNHIAFITLNRPTKLNALSVPMLGGLTTALCQYAVDAEVRAVVLRGAGQMAFCAGGDLRALYQSCKNSGTAHREFFAAAAEYRLDYLLHVYPKPYVVLMDGITMGGGMGLAQGSTLRIVGDRTCLAMPEVGIGLVPDAGGSYFLSRLPGCLGLYLALTGAQIGGADALYTQLADVYLTSDAVTATLRDLEHLAWTGEAEMDVRQTVWARAASGLHAPLRKLRPAIDRHFVQDSVPAILASLDQESQSDHREWARQTAQLMRTRSPTMLCVALRQLQRGKSMGLPDCLRMELGIVKHCFEQGDFIEGVRALIIDKDNTPHWRPDRLDDVTDAAVRCFFSERWQAAEHPLADLGRSQHDTVRS